MLKKMLVRASITFSLTILFPLILTAQPADSAAKRVSFNILPFANYSSDIGFGFGAKGVVKNLYRNDESFDLVVFGSSKGEQWYAFTFSIPDFEIRQGKQYPLSLDLKMEFKKSLKSNFFGMGNASEDNEWQFPREMIKTEAILGRAFTPVFIGETAIVLVKTSVYDYQGMNPLMSPTVPGSGETFISCLSFRARFDSRDSQIHPRRGVRFSANADFSAKRMGSDRGFQRYRMEWSGYRSLWHRDFILAGRIWLQQVQGEAPYFEQSFLGGTWTLRGYKLERFIDKACILTSAEIRFPVYRWFGGVVFLDGGRTFDTIGHASLAEFHHDLGLGFRYYLENFVTRFDVGKSDEGTRIFFHFGHVF